MRDKLDKRFKVTNLYEQRVPKTLHWYVSLQSANQTVLPHLGTLMWLRGHMTATDGRNQNPPPMPNPLTIGDLEPIENNGMSHLQPLLMSGLHSAQTRVSYMCEKFDTLDNRWFLDPERLDSNPEWTNQQAVILDELRRCSERQGPYWAVLLLCVAHIHIYGECMYIHMCAYTHIWRRRERVCLHFSLPPVSFHEFPLAG